MIYWRNFYFEHGTLQRICSSLIIVIFFIRQQERKNTRKNWINKTRCMLVDFVWQHQILLSEELFNIWDYAIAHATLFLLSESRMKIFPSVRSFDFTSFLLQTFFSHFSDKVWNQFFETDRETKTRSLFDRFRTFLVCVK